MSEMKPCPHDYTNENGRHECRSKGKKCPVGNEWHWIHSACLVPDKDGVISPLNENIVWQDFKVRREHREHMVSTSAHNGKIIWFTGLSNSGKSTIAALLEAELIKRGYKTYHLDGDNIRHGLNNDLGFSAQDRKENIRRIGEVAKLFLDAGIVVLVSFISPFREDRHAVRKAVPSGDFIEVYCKCPLEVCERRDTKGHYKKARAGEINDFTGISSPYETPVYPDVVLFTDVETPADCVEKILHHV